MTARLRSIPRCDYHSLADVSLPRHSSRSSRRKKKDADPDKLYQLTVLEERENESVKVRYVGYGSEHEWRSKKTLYI